MKEIDKKSELILNKKTKRLLDLQDELNACENELKDVKEEIITSLVSEHKSEDTSVQYKALEKMREDAKLKFTDTVLEKKYETYKSQYNK